jgi:adenine-specific DNA-methyltransferase
MRAGLTRRFAIVESADYFERLIVPRVARVCYAADWKDGRPEKEPVIGPLLDDKPAWMTRTPRLVKVLTLERYEDSLDALRLPERAIQSDAFFDDPTALGYRLADVVEGSPVLLNTAMLADPFDYTLAVCTPEGYRNKTVDLVETWNLLAGLRVRRRRATKGPAGRVLLVEADTRDGEKVLVVWRATGDLSPSKDREFVSAAVVSELGVELSSYATVWHNGDSIFGRNARSLDSEFQRLMMQREER